jgi:RNA-directed DNA polymerase
VLLLHVSLDRLVMAYRDLSPKAAPGVDGVTWEDYGQDLAGNLRDLHDRVHSGRCQARPSRRAYIPKADGRLRPLGIAALEDKIDPAGRHRGAQRRLRDGLPGLVLRVPARAQPA